MAIGVLSDIHSNIHALEAVLERLGDCEATICPGDIVGYGASPRECVSRVRSLGMSCVLGNHDAACIGLLSLGWFNPYAAAAARWTVEQLSGASAQYLRGLPRSSEHDEIAIYHGTPREPTTEYLTDSLQARDSFALCEKRVILVGHTHVPLAFMERDQVEPLMVREGEWVSYGRRRLIFNPGSVGQPRDGDPRASYAVIDPDKRRIRLERADYDVEAAREDILGAGLPEMLGDRLLVGR